MALVQLDGSVVEGMLSDCRFTVALVQLDGSIVEGMLSDCRSWRGCYLIVGYGDFIPPLLGRTMRDNFY